MKLYLGKKEKTPNFGRGVHNHFQVQLLIFCSKRYRLRLISRCDKFQQPNQFLQSILSYLKKIISNHLEGGWEGQKKSVPYIWLTWTLYQGLTTYKQIWRGLSEVLFWWCWGSDTNVVQITDVSIPPNQCPPRSLNQVKCLFSLFRTIWIKQEFRQNVSKTFLIFLLIFHHIWYFIKMSAM